MEEHSDSDTSSESEDDFNKDQDTESNQEDIDQRKDVEPELSTPDHNASSCMTSRSAASSSKPLDFSTEGVTARLTSVAITSQVA